MARFSDVLLTVDFDRTLTAPDSTIPQANLDAIRYFMAEGGAFTMNTGRSLPMFRHLMEVIPMNAPVLLYNGSAAYDMEREAFLFAHTLELDAAATINRVMELYPELEVEIQGMDYHYNFRENPLWDAFCERNDCPGVHTSPDGDVGPFLKFCVYGPLRSAAVSHLFEATPEEIAYFDAVTQTLSREFGDKVSVFRAGNRIADVQAAGVSKGRAARELQQKLGRKILVCVGDGENDVTMLDGADYAFCPADGVVADRYPNVCPCGEGAVAEVIYKKIPEILGESS